MANYKMMSQFLKDLSFESPNVPELFFKQDNGAASLEISYDIQVKGADGGIYMVDLITKVHSKLNDGDKTIFMIDTTFTGLLQIEGTPEEADLQRTLAVDIPALLFPFVRSLVLRTVADSGFPPVALQPVDFAGMHEKKLAEGK